jgi:hypothetical protein
VTDIYEPYLPPTRDARGWKVGPTEFPAGLAAATGAGLDAQVSLQVNAAMDLAHADGAGLPANVIFTPVVTIPMVLAQANADALPASPSVNVGVAADLAVGSADPLTPTLSITSSFTPFTDTDVNKSNVAVPSGATTLWITLTGAGGASGWVPPTLSPMLRAAAAAVQAE